MFLVAFTGSLHKFGSPSECKAYIAKLANEGLYGSFEIIRADTVDTFETKRPPPIPQPDPPPSIALAAAG